jgi:hypothetical protein
VKSSGMVNLKVLKIVDAVAAIIDFTPLQK